MIVASFTGAWIETSGIWILKAFSQSHPLRVRGLKHNAIFIKLLILVASFTGAWIETLVIATACSEETRRILYGCVD